MAVHVCDDEGMISNWEDSPFDLRRRRLQSVERCRQLRRLGPSFCRELRRAGTNRAEAEPPARNTPLLFVHGAWYAAWSWDEFFLPYFASQGYACSAPSLRGHGASSGRDRLRWTRLREYVDDVADAVAHLPAQPILIGHSMGGFLVQKYLEEHAALGAVLVAPIPPTGAWRAALYILRQHPISFVKGNLSLSLAPLVATPELARDLFFSASMPDERVKKYQQRLQDESYLAFLDLVALDLVKTRRVNRVPMLVVGAEDDTLVSQRADPPDRCGV